MTTLFLNQSTKKQLTPQGRRSFKISSFFVSLLFALVLVLTPGTFAQGVTGAITGDVTDASGASIPGATVSIRQVDTNDPKIRPEEDRGSSWRGPQAPGSVVALEQQVTHC